MNTCSHSGIDCCASLPCGVENSLKDLCVGLSRTYGSLSISLHEGLSLGSSCVWIFAYMFVCVQRYVCVCVHVFYVWVFHARMDP